MRATSVQSTAAEAMAPKQDVEASEIGQENLILLIQKVIGPPVDENAVRLESKALSLLLALPSESHLHIIENLAHSVEPSPS